MTRTRHGLHAVVLLFAAAVTALGCNCGGTVPADADGGLDTDAGRDAGTDGRDAGRDAGQSATGTVTRFRPSVMGRQGHAMVELADGTVLVSGALRTNPLTGRPEAELFDLGAGTVTTVGPMQDGRYSHRLTLLADGRVLVTGGYGGSTPAILRTAELYDPATRKFTRVASELTVPRVRHTAARLSTGALAGKVLLIGGGPLGAAMTVELFDPATSTFSAVTTTGAPAERLGAAVRLLDDGTVLITAGLVVSGEAPVVESYVYTPSTATFRRVGDAVRLRHDPTATVLLDGRVLVVGGRTGTGSLGPPEPIAELYDPSTGTFSAGPTLATPRRSHTASRLGSGRVVVAGGISDNTTLGTIELFVPASNSFTPGANLVGARSFIESIPLSDGRVFANGGQAMNGVIFGIAELISD